jgi:hypothetical protein
MKPIVHLTLAFSVLIFGGISLAASAEPLPPTIYATELISSMSCEEGQARATLYDPSLAPDQRKKVCVELEFAGASARGIIAHSLTTFLWKSKELVVDAFPVIELKIKEGTNKVIAVDIVNLD